MNTAHCPLCFCLQSELKRVSDERDRLAKELNRLQQHHLDEMVTHIAMIMDANAVIETMTEKEP